MRRRVVKVMTTSWLEELSTKELLGRRKRLLACEESLELSDIYEWEFSPGPDEIWFKESAEWKAAYREVKDVLSTREHVPGGEERRQARKVRAERARSIERRNGR